MSPIRLAILGSTRGTHLLMLLEAIKQKRLSATIEAVITNKSDALIFERAKEHQLPVFFIDPQHKSREVFDQELSEKLNELTIDLIVLVGYMRIISEPFVLAWANKIINVHPSLLPAFAGGMDENVHQAVLESGARETGCTIHYVTSQVDAGPILMQKKCVVLPHDTVNTLKARVQQLESEALVEVINDISNR